MMQRYVIEGELSDLNTFIRVERSNKFQAAAMKQAETSLVAQLAKFNKWEKLPDLNYWVTFRWFCKNKRKDPDNIAFAKKFIFDGLVTAGVIKGDGWATIAGFFDYFSLDAKRPRVEVEFLAYE